MKKISLLSIAFLTAFFVTAFPCVSQEAESEENSAVEISSAEETVSEEIAVTEAEAQEEEEATTSYMNLDVLLAGDAKQIDATKEDIKALTFNMDYAEREMLYSKNATKLGLPIFLNWIPGFGTGSRKQGDTVFANVELGLDVGATVLIIGGGLTTTIGILGEVLVAIFTLGYGDPEALKPFFDVGVGLLIGGAAVWFGNRVMGTIVPILYSKKRNANLKSALGLDAVAEEVSVAPIINPVQSEYGLALSMKF